MNKAQEMMDQIDPTIRVDVSHNAQGVYIHAFDTTVTPNHVQEWIVPMISYEEFIDSWTLTKGQATGIAEYWQRQRQYRTDPEHIKSAVLNVRKACLDHKIEQLQRTRAELDK